MPSKRTVGLFILAACAAAACSGRPGPADGAATDASGAADATPDDASDASRPNDAGTMDAGTMDAAPHDGAPTDAGRDAGAPEPTGPLVLYVASDGDDAESGTTSARAVLTLTRVHEIIETQRPARDVEVRIAPGTYYGQRVRWTYTMPDHSIRFVTAAADHTRPIFDGCSAAGACPGGTWFILSSSSGEPTNLEFRYLRVTRYQTAISLNGSRASRATSNGSNTLYGMYFDRIGNVFEPSLRGSTACVRLVNSDDNVIANNHFVDVINIGARDGLIHSIYAAHGSERNRIERNRFQRSSGDPVRIRDYSNDNIIRDNRFIKVGTNAGYTDWYCDHDARTDCTSENPECPSWGNEFRDNVLDGDWSCSPLRTWELFQDETTSGCSPPSASAHRVRTSGNTQSATPCSMN